jgi:ABC-type branched-subunit amino acid transport system ATPase component
MSARLEVDRLSFAFGGVHALHHLSMVIPPQRITGVIGPNGAGKTTLFNCVSGLLRPAAGRVLVDGLDVTGIAPERMAALGIARTFQLARGFERMSVYEHLMVHGREQPGERLMAGIFGSRASRNREDELHFKARNTAKRLNLDHLLNAPITALSGGQKKLLEIGRALMSDPKLILLDEPMAGVNPTLRNEIANHLRSLRDRGVTLVLIEHDMPLVETVCDYVCVMDRGTLLAGGTFKEIAANPAVLDAYLGVSDGIHRPQ